MESILPRVGRLTGIVSQLYLIIIFNWVNPASAQEQVVPRPAASALEQVDTGSDMADSLRRSHAQVVPLDSAQREGIITFDGIHYQSIPHMMSNPALSTESGGKEASGDWYDNAMAWRQSPCGDVDANGHINISDAVTLIGYIYGTGPTPEFERADANCNNSVNLADVVYIIAYIFGGGPAPCAACGPGTVYVVLAMDTEPYFLIDNVYSQELNLVNYDRTGPVPYVHEVMNKAYRSQYTDSYGGHPEFTFYLMTAEIFCQSSNDDCNAIYTAMEKFSDDIALYGDELAWHYHHFAWLPSDYDSLTHYWTQIITFDGTQYGEQTDVETAEKMLNHLLVDKDFFPTSFRGGWTWENTDFSNWLDKIIPVDFSNLAPMGSPFPPVKRPFWNYYNWTHAPNDWSYYHPSRGDYQSGVPGDLKRTMFRCSYSGLAGDQLSPAFRRASEGEDVCVSVYGHTYSSVSQFFRPDWQHNLEVLSNSFNVPFKFATANEAARNLLGYASDTVAPHVFINRESNSLAISVDEEIFQSIPYCALLTGDGDCNRVFPQRAGPNLWRLDVSSLSKFSLSVGVCDRAGNAATAKYTD